MPNLTRITFEFPGLRLIVDYSHGPAPIETTGHEIATVRQIIPGLRKTRPVVVEARRACGGAK